MTIFPQKRLEMTFFDPETLIFDHNMTFSENLPVRSNLPNARHKILYKL